MNTNGINVSWPNQFYPMTVPGIPVRSDSTSLCPDADVSAADGQPVRHHGEPVASPRAFSVT